MEALPHTLVPRTLMCCSLRTSDMEMDLTPIERALTRIDFGPEADGWRWNGRVEGHRVKIDFLCDLPELRDGEFARPASCETLRAANLRGTGYVARDWAFQDISGTTKTGEPTTVKVCFARLQGYLLSKCVAVRWRGADKDYYDFPYVLIHNTAGGPAEAATLLLNGTLADVLPGLDSTFREVRERYRSTTDVGSRRYAAEMKKVDLQTDESRLRADAVAAVQEFFRLIIGP